MSEEEFAEVIDPGNRLDFATYLHAKVVDLSDELPN